MVAAAFQGSPKAAHFATIVKLARVLMLAPLIIIIGFGRSRHLPTDAPPVPLLPWFVVGVIAFVVLGSIVPVSPDARHIAGTTTGVLFTIALAALGLSTHLQSVTARGYKPLVVGAGAWVFIASFALACVAAARALGWL